MWCMKCQKELHECTCTDINERLRAISGSKNIASKWCTVCDKHYSQCKCERPIWGVRSDGKTSY